jgi:hypothetical protein
MHTRRLPLLFIFLAIAGLLVTLSLPAAHADDEVTLIERTDIDTCLACHGEKVDADHLKRSVHGTLACQDCHKGIDRVPHPENAPGKHPQCATCHTDKNTAFGRSVHATAKDAAGRPIACATCHGGNPHEMRNPKNLPLAQQEAACRACHADKASALQGSVHAKVKSCLACHGGNAHGIKPAPAHGTAANTLCQRCHAADMQQMLTGAHGQALKRTDKPLRCLDCHGQANAHAIAHPTKLTGADKEAMCRKCHANKATALQASAHGNVNMQADKRPTCLYCHGAQFHSVAAANSLTPTQKDSPCRSCHTEKVEELARSVHGTAGTSCLGCHGGNAHGVKPPRTLPQSEKIAACATCHKAKVAAYTSSVHARPDKQPGDHPTCFSCHGDNPHLMQKSPAPTPLQKVTLCSRCHENAALMARYGRTDAVEAYMSTYHGRAITKLRLSKEATCVDCHGIHEVQDPGEPNAPTSPRRTVEICGKCHTDKRMDFAYTYASHLRMKVERSVVDPLQALYLQLLSLNPILYPPALLLLGLVYHRSRRRPVFAHGVRILYFGLNIFSIFAAVITLASLWLMHAGGEPDISAKMTVPLVVLIGLAVVGLLVARVAVPKE